MAKTYTAPTSVVAGDAITASLYNTYVGTNVANLIVPPSCRVEKTTQQNISTTSDTIVTWDVEKYDTDGMVTLSSSTSQITINTPGIYLITAGVAYEANATNRRVIYVTKNGTSYSENIIGDNRASVYEGSAQFQVTTMIELANADVIRMLVYQNSGATLKIPAVLNAAEQANTFLSLAWIGRTS